jgi:hypothetical protein
MVGGGVDGAWLLVVCAAAGKSIAASAALNIRILVSRFIDMSLCRF